MKDFTVTVESLMTVEVYNGEHACGDGGHCLQALSGVDTTTACSMIRIN